MAATPEQQDSLVKARQVARFLHTKRRIQKINDADPPYTDEERQELAAILLAGSDDQQAAS